MCSSDSIWSILTALRQRDVAAVTAAMNRYVVRDWESSSQSAAES
jgi:hypothetical protein